MSHKLLVRFVAQGMKKNKRTLIPYLIAGTITVMISFILTSLAYCPYIYSDHKEAFYGAQTIGILLSLASQIVGFFAILFLFYANQFVIKSRKKEMALYGVLGMSKKNISFVMVMETVIHAVISIGSGIAIGTFLNKIMLLILYRVIHQAPVNGMFFSMVALKNTILLFGIIYLVCLIYNVSSIRVGNPIELLNSDHIGEKEPKVKIIPLLIGVVTLVGGYALAVTTDSTVDAINVLFISIILVIIATYCLFTEGSIFFLKMLRSNKKFYYQTKNFISVSNLMFRLKHNAAGLASICVLATGVIILLTCASSLMMLSEKNINDRYPTDVKIEVMTDEADLEKKVLAGIHKAVEKSGIDAGQLIYRQSKTVVARQENHALVPMDESDFSNISDCVDLYFFTQDDYNRYTDHPVSLQSDEVLVYSSEDEANDQTIDLYGKNYQIVGETDYDAVYYTINPTMSLFERKLIVLKDEKEVNRIVSHEKNLADAEKYHVYVGYNTKAQLSRQERESFEKMVSKMNGDFRVSFKETERIFMYNIYGGAFFVGIFLAVLFLMATVLIIYYKQMSEGYEDQKRFEILAKVGLTEKEAKTTIKRQVMILFFLPVIAAFIHVIFASSIIRLFLHMVLVVDMWTFAFSIAAVCVIFLFVYLLVYRITSIQYYRIVYGNKN